MFINLQILKFSSIIVKFNLPHIKLIRSLAVVAIFLANKETLHGQLITNGGITPTDLVQNVLLGGGVQVSNIVYTGATTAIGTFDGTNSNIGLNYGIVMTTGNLTFPNGPPGPNNSTNAGIDNNSGGSALLEQYANSFGINEPTFNATTLQFDFVPQGDTVLFRYVFGSEEYKEYVGSNFNDVFGFFISGPNPNGGNYNNQNIALIPNTATFVSINNVNHLTNSAYFIDNESPFPGQTVQYDGFTTVLTALAVVVPCSTYTIRIAITDVGDAFYDSGVFLEAKSFSSAGSEVSYIVEGYLDSDTLYEGCGQALITFTWNGDNSTDRTVLYNITGNATNGTDYTFLPGSVLIPAGQSTATISVSAAVDGISEPTEFITIQINDPNACPNVPLPHVTIPIKNVDPIQVTAMPDTSFNCNNQVVFLTATASGGVEPLTYSWSNGVGVGNPVPVIVRNSTTFVVTVSDACGTQQGVDSVRITVPNAAPLVLSFTNDTSVCPGHPVFLNAQASGGIGDIVFNWSIDVGNSNSTIVYPQQTTLYSVLVEDSCGNTLSESALVLVRAPNAAFDYYYIENNSAQFKDQSSGDVVSWFWDFGDGGTSIEQNPIHEFADTGWYNVMLIVTNEYGCTDTVIQPFYSYPPLSLFIPNAFTPNLDGINDVFSVEGQGFVSFYMSIFDRWGREFYRTDDIKRGWTGYDENNRKYPIGVYSYRIDVTTPPGYKYRYIGRVTLIR